MSLIFLPDTSPCSFRGTSGHRIATLLHPFRNLFHEVYFVAKISYVEYHTYTLHILYYRHYFDKYYGS